MTHLARSNRPASRCAKLRLARDVHREGRVLALRLALADGRYHIDSQAIAAKLIAAIDPHFQLIGKH